MIEKLERPQRLDEDKIEALKALFPSAVSDGKINFDALKDELNDNLAEADAGDEHYGLYWSGKRKAKRLAAKPATGTLIPAKGEGIDEESTQNLIIEGDNLEVLRILQKSYSGRVKLIYIDPPYNTGNDFVYKDDFKEPVESYLERSEQQDDSGLLTSNPKSSGRFHSNWLDMIFPRLKLAHELLKEDGVIFVSIDDNEVHNLRHILDEIFGQENFRASISWQKKYSVSNNFLGIASIKDEILVYSKSDRFQNGFLPRTEESISRYSNPDNDSRGVWKAVDYWNQASPKERPNLTYPILNPNTGQVIHPSKKAWKYSQETHNLHVAENRIWWGINGDNSVPALKLFLTDVREGLIPNDFWTHSEAGHTDEAKKELDLIFGVAPFDTPKPTKLISRIIQVAGIKEQDVVLDFFAGSGTTAQAVLDYNFEHKSTISYLLIQIPEKILNPIYPTIAEITKERVRRVSRKLKSEGASGDLGFRVLKLERSSFVKWRTAQTEEEMLMQAGLFAKGGTLVPGWERPNVLTEIMLLEGYPLDSSIEPCPDFLPTNVDAITHPELGTRLLVCLDEDPIPEEAVDVLSQAKFKKDIFICLERSITDELKVRMADSVQRVKAL